MTYLFRVSRNDGCVQRCRATHNDLLNGRDDHDGHDADRRTAGSSTNN